MLEKVVMTDRHGIQWRVAPNYQEHSVEEPGWLALLSAMGGELSFTDVLEIYGFGENGNRYLKVAWND